MPNCVGYLLLAVVVVLVVATRNGSVVPFSSKQPTTAAATETTLANGKLTKEQHTYVTLNRRRILAGGDSVAMTDADVS